MVGRLGRDQSSYAGCNLAFWSLGVAIVEASPLMTYIAVMYRRIPKVQASGNYLKLINYINAVLIPICSAFHSPLPSKTTLLYENHSLRGLNLCNVKG
jgi:hypothetical protein